MRTGLPPEVLAQLHTQCQTPPGTPARFVNPHDVARVEKLIRERGEQWAASIVLRDLGRRSVLRPDLPWLTHDELALLLAAEQAEFDHLTTGL